MRKLWVTAAVLVVLVVASNLFTVWYVGERADMLQAENTELQQQVLTLEDEIDARDLAIRRLVNDSVTMLEEDLDTQRHAIVSLGDKIGSVEVEFEDRLALKTSDFSALADGFLDAVVSVRTSDSLGSGVIVHPDGYVVTNYHVIADTDDDVVETHSRKEYGYRVVAVSEEQDLALLKILYDRTFAWLPLADSDDVTSGTRVVALGSPLGLDFTVTEGIVSAVNRRNADGIEFVQIDVPVNPGNSGGPVVNIKGEVVGITNAKLRGEGLGFAIEADEVASFLEGKLPE